MMKLIFFILLIGSTFNSIYSQDYWTDLFRGTSYGPTTELGIGVSSLYQLKLEKPLLGININLGIEGHKIWMGENRIQTYTVFRTSYFFKDGIKKDGVFNAIPIDTSQNLDQILVPYSFSETVSYFSIDLGKDYFLYTNEKEDFIIYSGFAMGINVANYIKNYELEEFNQEDYELQTEEGWEKNKKTRDTNIKLGINLGLKYYAGVSSILFVEATTFVDLIPNNNLHPYYTIDSRFFIGLNMGYKYEF